MSGVQFTLSPLEGRRCKVVLSRRHLIERKYKENKFCFFCVYLLWAGKGRWGWGGCPASSVRGRALRFITVVLLRGQTLTATVLLECIRILLLRKLAMIYCKDSTMVIVCSWQIRKCKKGRLMSDIPLFDRIAGHPLFKCESCECCLFECFLESGKISSRLCKCRCPCVAGLVELLMKAFCRLCRRLLQFTSSGE